MSGTLGRTRGSTPKAGLLDDGALVVLDAVTGEVTPAPTMTGADLLAHFDLDPDGLVARPRGGVTFEIWAEMVARLQAAHKTVPWWLADLLAYGDEAYGEDAASVLETSQWAYQTLANYASTARRVAPERRRADLPFAHHAEVASLEPERQVAMLEAASENGWRREDLREAVREEKRTQARQKALAAPVPEGAAPGGYEIRQGDARKTGIDGGSVHLIVTSPPYDLGKDYEAQPSGVGAQDAYERLLDYLCAEAYRVLAPCGRIALNVPIDTTRGGYRPLLATATRLLVANGLRYAATIIWHDGAINKSVARGSLDSASAPRIQTPAEAIILASKGDWKRDGTGKTSRITREEWLAWTNGYWAVPPETNPWEGHEAAYPVEIPYRLIKLLSFAEDTVLDPCIGSGTTAVAAYRLGQAKMIGLDTDERMIGSTLRRLALVRATGL